MHISSAMLRNTVKLGNAAGRPVQPLRAVCCLHEMQLQDVRIRENSWLARVAAMKLNVDSVALTLGKTIHLYRASRQDLLQNNRWLRHELAHVEQFRRYGFFTFIFMYLTEWLKKGYYANRFEVEARNAEIGL